MTNEERRPTGLLHSADELRRLIREYPTLPLLVFAGEAANIGDYSYTSCSYINAHKDEYLDCAQVVNDCKCFTDRDDFKESLANCLVDTLDDWDCTDEDNRFLKRMTACKREVYPLAENNIQEKDILEWAKQQPLFNNFYKTNARCGCMYCPMASYINFAYLLKYYPENFDFMIARMRETEKLREAELGRPFSVISSKPKYNADYLDHIIRTKWLKILNEKENEAEQLRFF